MKNFSLTFQKVDDIFVFSENKILVKAFKINNTPVATLVTKYDDFLKSVCDFGKKVFSKYFDKKLIKIKDVTVYQLNELGRSKNFLNNKAFTEDFYGEEAKCFFIKETERYTYTIHNKDKKFISLIIVLNNRDFFNFISVSRDYDNPNNNGYIIQCTKLNADPFKENLRLYDDFVFKAMEYGWENKKYATFLNFPENIIAYISGKNVLIKNLILNGRDLRIKYSSISCRYYEDYETEFHSNVDVTLNFLNKIVRYNDFKNKNIDFSKFCFEMDNKSKALCVLKFS